jgi:hypothetical protein
MRCFEMYSDDIDTYNMPRRLASNTVVHSAFLNLSLFGGVSDVIFANSRSNIGSSGMEVPDQVVFSALA